MKKCDGRKEGRRSITRGENDGFTRREGTEFIESVEILRPAGARAPALKAGGGRGRALRGGGPPLE